MRYFLLFVIAFPVMCVAQDDVVKKTIPVDDEIFEIDAVSVDSNVVFVIVEKMPTYPGGEVELLNYLGANITYPEEARNEGVSGVVYIKFVVDQEGAITKAKIAQGVDPRLDAEALRVVRAMPNWDPGQQDGKAVKVRYIVPIKFSLVKHKDILDNEIKEDEGSSGSTRSGRKKKRRK